jgi:hypothetical protein
MTAPSPAETAFARLSERFADEPGVTSGTGFGRSPGLRVDGRIFAMLPHDALVVKLPAERCAAMVEAGEGALLRNGSRTMREWLVVASVDDDAWAALVADALAYVRG